MVCLEHFSALASYLTDSGNDLFGRTPGVCSVYSLFSLTSMILVKPIYISFSLCMILKAICINFSLIWRIFGRVFSLVFMKKGVADIGLSCRDQSVWRERLGESRSRRVMITFTAG